jgi:hypothetical protein
MTVRHAISGFYAVLDRDDEALARALVREARVVQLRIKPRGGGADAGELVRIARMARRICDNAGAALIVNDRLDVALASDADGVHLGQTDLPIAAARRISGVLSFTAPRKTGNASSRPACPRTRTAACSSWKPDRTSRTQSSCRRC